MTVVPLLLLLCAIGVMPIVYNGGTAYWLPLELSFLTAAVVVWLFAGWWCGREANHAHFHPILWLLLFLVLFGVLIHRLPWPWLVDHLSPAASEIWKSFNALGLKTVTPTLSIAPDLTLGRVFLIFIAAMLFFLVSSHCRTKLTLKLALLAVIVAALGNAILSFVEFFTTGSTGADGWLVFVGAFLNRNHFGFMMVMGILSCMGLMAAIAAEDDRKKRRKGIENNTSLMIPVALIGFLLVAALILSLSRGAFMGATVGMLFFGGVWLMKSHDAHGRNRQVMMVLLSMTALTLVLAMPFAMTALTERYEAILGSDLSLNDRWLVWKGTVRVIKDYWLTGCGLGAFPKVIEGYDCGVRGGQLVVHAHNDYLEFMAEMGVPITVLIYLLMAFFWLFSLRRCLHDHDGAFRWLGIGALSAILGCAVHELFDYNLQAYSNTMLYAVLLAVIAVSASHNRRPENWSFMTSTERTQNREARWHWRLVMIPLGGVILGCTTPWLMKMISTGFAANRLIEEYSTENGERIGKFEHSRRIALANRSKKVTGLRQRVLRQAAVAYADYAFQEEIPEEDKGRFIEQACLNIIDALAYAPLDGQTALIAARIFKAANTMNIRHDSVEMVLGLYAWARRCHPFIPLTVHEATFAAYDAFQQEEDKEKRSHYRRLALQGMVLLLANFEEGQPEVYDALSDLLEGAPHILEYTPDTMRHRLPLLDYLVDSQFMQEALELCESLLKKSALSYDDYASSEDNPLTSEEMRLARLRLLDRHYAILDRLGMQDKLADAWDEMEKQLFLCDTYELVTVEERMNEIDRRKTEDKKARSIHVTTPDGLLWQAEKALEKHDIDETISKTIQLAYFVERKLDKSLLYKGLELIKDWRNALHPKSFYRARFLESAFHILLAEQGITENYDAHVVELEKLESEQGSSSENSWLQMHLVPYYLGRSQELDGEPSLAIESYRRCLDLCPDNLWAMQRLDKLSETGKPSLLTEHEQKLMRIVNSRPRPIAYMAQAVQWLGVRVNPREITKMHQVPLVEYLFLCKGDITQQYSWRMVYSDSKKNHFADQISFGGASELTWKAGQLVYVYQEITPFINFMSSEKLPGNGPVYLQPAFETVPRMRVCPFSIRIE